MFLYLFILIAGLSTAELYVLINVGAVIGAIPTIGLTILSALIGASLVRSQGIQTAFKAQQKINEGKVPAQQVVEGIMLIIAGACLIMPGFITDLCGMIILIPPVRRYFAKRLLNSSLIKFQTPPNGPGNGAGGGHTFDGEYQRRDSDDHDRLN
ncbi:FxsA family protein [Celerinatantimonas yamalensis]|uniref:FxsA family protein n=1 Tax=Celerinatantimonas yamalensis TaxID=559956 RepID=A0ABW9G5G5_9GAMM